MKVVVYSTQCPHGSTWDSWYSLYSDRTLCTAYFQAGLVKKTKHVCDVNGSCFCNVFSLVCLHIFETSRGKMSDSWFYIFCCIANTRPSSNPSLVLQTFPTQLIWQRRSDHLAPVSNLTPHSHNLLLSIALLYLLLLFPCHLLILNAARAVFFLSKPDWVWERCAQARTWT